jgi:hypothetical protein
MIIDSENTYFDGYQGVTTADTYDSFDEGNFIDHYAGLPEVVADEAGPQILPLHVIVQVSGALMGGGTSIQAILEEDDNDGFLSAVALVAGPVIALADLGPGAILLDASSVRVKERYTQISLVSLGTFTYTGLNLLSGITAWLGADVQHGVPSGIIT